MHRSSKSAERFVRNRLAGRLAFVVASAVALFGSNAAADDGGVRVYRDSLGYTHRLTVDDLQLLRGVEQQATEQVARAFAQGKLTVDEMPDAEKRALGDIHLQLWGPHFGVADSAAELEFVGYVLDTQLPDTWTHLRYRQVCDGVPVHGAELLVHVSRDRVSVNGSFLLIDDATRTAPTLSANDATAYAILHTIQANREMTRVGEPELVYFSDGVGTNRTRDDVALAWFVDLVGLAPGDQERQVVDAHTGAIIATLPLVKKLDREVYDCSYYNGSSYDCVLDVWDNNYRYGRFESQDECGLHPPFLSWFCDFANQTPTDCGDNYDTDTVYENLGVMHDYFLQRFARDGTNGLGGVGCGGGIPTDTTRGNIIWDKQSSWIYGSGCPALITTADCLLHFCTEASVLDMVGHEYAHGLTIWRGFSYSGQNAALDESHSDLIAELAGVYYNGQNDWIISGGPNRWTIYADPYYTPGIIRHLGQPSLGEQFGWHIDRNYSPLSDCAAFGGSGGYYYISTIFSKAFYLLADGGRFQQFNRCRIEPIGFEAAEQILHRAVAVEFSPSENFNAAYVSTIAACEALYGAGSDTCISVARALQAVELDQPGACSDIDQAQPPACAEPEACVDSDDGQDTAVPGQVMMAVPDRIEIAYDPPGLLVYETHYYKDYCVVGKTLAEYYCDPNADEVRQVFVQCPGQCIDGACVICADSDDDQDVDMTEFAALAGCLSGPGVAYAGGCEGSDLDHDTDVDLADFALLQTCFSGDGVPSPCSCGESRTRMARTPSAGNGTFQPRPAPDPAAGVAGQIAPAFEFVTVGGETMGSDVAAGQVLVLTFASPDCGWCRRQLPRIGEIEAAYGPYGVRFFNVIGGMGGAVAEPGELLATMADFGCELIPVVDDFDQALKRSFDGLLPRGGMPYPTTFVIDPDGRIAHCTVGARPLDEMTATLDGLLGAEAPPAVDASVAEIDATLSAAMDGDTGHCTD
jgi:Zn-dependent metalloprotease/peroxiredoxin